MFLLFFLIVLSDHLLFKHQILSLKIIILNHLTKKINIQIIDVDNEISLNYRKIFFINIRLKKREDKRNKSKNLYLVFYANMAGYQSH